MPRSGPDDPDQGISAEFEDRVAPVIPIPEEDQLFENLPVASIHPSVDERDSQQMVQTTANVLETAFIDRMQEEGLVTPQPEFPIESLSNLRGGGDTPDIAPPPFRIQYRSELTLGGGDHFFRSTFQSGSSSESEGKSFVQPSQPTQQRLTSQEELLGHELNLIALEVDRRYGRRFDDIVTQMLGAPFSWRSLRNIVASVITSGEITWGRIVVVIAFALRLAYRLFILNTPGVLRDMATNVAQYLLDLGVLKWIWERYGGWGALRSLVPRSISITVVGAVTIAGVFMLLASYFLSSSSK